MIYKFRDGKIAQQRAAEDWTAILTQSETSPLHGTVRPHESDQRQPQAVQVGGIQLIQLPNDWSVMFARVITAQAGDSGVDDVIRLANQQLPDARRRPGFEGFFLLVDDQSGKVITISLRESREALEAVTQDTADGIHDEGASETGVRCASTPTRWWSTSPRVTRTAYRHIPRARRGDCLVTRRQRGT